MVVDNKKKSSISFILKYFGLGLKSSYDSGSCMDE